MSLEEKMKINLKNNILITEENGSKKVLFNFSTAMFEEKSAIYKLLSRSNWIFDTYLKSKEYEELNINKYIPEFKGISFRKEIDFPYINFINELMGRIETLFLEENLDRKDTFTFLGYTNINEEEFKERAISIIEELTIKFYNDSLNADFINIKYFFEKQNKVSEIQFICKNTNSRVKITNSSKLISQVIMKRAVNRLSIVSSRLNDDFRKVGKTRPMYKVFFAGRRNAFEEIDKSILESIIKGV